jgi:hypothetical protein
MGNAECGMRSRESELATACPPWWGESVRWRTGSGEQSVRGQRSEDGGGSKCGVRSAECGMRNARLAHGESVRWRTRRVNFMGNETRNGVTSEND